MSQAETLLNSIAAYPTNDTTVSTSPINDYLIIDAEGRIINVPATETLFGVETDMNAERKYFQCPRIVGDNIDLTKLGLRISYRNAIGEEDGYVVDDVKVNGEFITFSWKLGGKLFKTKGTIYFAICAVDVDDNGTETCVWNTTLATGNVLEGLRVKLTETEEEQARDILQSLIDTLRKQAASYSNRMTDEGMSWIADLESTGEGERELIESKGAETLATIPEDYTATYNAADEALRKKAKAIVMEEEGEFISVNDASDDYVRGLKVFGKSGQVTTTGKNLLRITAKTQTLNGVTFTVNSDGSVTVVGTATANTNCLIASDPSSAYGPKSIRFGGGVVGSENTYFFQTNTYKGEVGTSHFDYDGKGTVVNLDNPEITKVDTYVRVKSGVTVNTVFYPMAYDSSIGDSTYEPYTGGKPAPNPEYPQEIASVGDIDNIVVCLYGSNIINPKTLLVSTNTSLEVSDDGYTIKAVGGTTSGWCSSVFSLPTTMVYLLRGKTVRIGCNSFTTDRSDANVRVGFNVKLDDGTSIYPASISPNHTTNTETIPENTVSMTFGIYTNNSGTILDTDNTIVVEGLRVSVSEHTDWEEYKEIQTISIPRSLPGIPVSSGGNYTDSSGQQWICDEVDFERGVYIQRVKREVLNSHRSWRTNSTYDNIYYTSFSDTADGTGVSMCTHFVNISGDSDVFNNSYTGAYFEYEYSQYNKYFNTGYDTVMDFVAWLDEQEANGTPVTLNYVLKTPIETSLTADELNAFRALHTNYPNTTVLNNSGATMRLEYNADTKLFINQPRIPTFDFTEMGLSPVKYGDMTTYKNIDTSEIEEALSKGAVKFKLKLSLDDDGNGVDEYIDVEFIANGTYMSQGEISMFQATSIILIEGMTFVSIVITKGAMIVMFGGGN